MTLAGVVWPKTPTFYKNVDNNVGLILGGTVIVIDPSSGSRDSMPGYAVIKGGNIIETGVIKIPLSMTIEGRLRYLDDRLNELAIKYPPDLLVIEEIPSRAHHYLMWAIGVTIAGVRAKFMQMPICVWKAAAKVAASYIKKSDEADANIMALSLLSIAKERVNGKHS